MSNKKSVDKLLNKIGMNNSYIGYCFWKTAISYYISLKEEDTYRLVKIGDIYKFISIKYNTTMEKAEKSMRFAKEKSNYIEKMKLEHKLKNKEFLITCVNKLIIK